MLDIPSIPTILQALLETREGRTEASLVDNVKDRHHAVKAMEALVRHGLVTRREDVVRLVEDERKLERVRALIDFYRGVQRAARKSLVFRGILNTTQYKCLIHLQTFLTIMEDEGFDRGEVEELLRKEKQDGYVEHMKIMYRSRQGLKHKLFPFIPLYYYPHFIIMNTDNVGHFRERLQGAGIALTEEDYLLGKYPKEIAQQSRLFIARERPHIRDRIKDEGFDIWWYYRF